MNTNNRHPSSFRDPAGFVFHANGHVYRKVAAHWCPHIALLEKSGLYETLTRRQWLVSHEIENGVDGMVIKPALVPFINYPYEWTFGMLKDAALLTLRICRESIRYGMILKDASAFNVVFRNGTPIFIDTLSFQTYDAAEPWVAYRQFCQQFLYPLLLVRYGHSGWQHQLMMNTEGMSANETAKLLPFWSRFSLPVWLHVFLPAMIRRSEKSGKVVFSQQKMEQLLDHLMAVVKKIARPVKSSTWGDYYNETILGRKYLKEKEDLFLQLLPAGAGGHALDIGANDGYFSKMLTDRGWTVTAIDSDENSVERLYHSKSAKIQPLWINLAQASPAIGWMNREREGFWSRYTAPLVVVLALIHHLYFCHQLPFEQQAEGFARLAEHWLVIEFIHPDDPKIAQLVAARNNLLDNYTEQQFISAFLQFFVLEKTMPMTTASRTLFLLKKKKLD